MLYELEQTSADLLPLAGFADDELERLLASVRGDSQFDRDPDAVPPLPAKPKSKLGEVYEVGPHRLYVGDAADALSEFYAGANLGCVLTDPPYGISLDTDYRAMGTGSKKAILRGTEPNVYAQVTGDDQPFDPAPFIAAFVKVKEQFWFGADYYRRRLSPDDRDGAYLVWDKRNEASDGGFGSGFELIWSRQPHKRDLLRHYFFGAFGVDGANRMHPTQKPVPLLMEILTRWAPPGIVADPFCGSGSTLIACERTDRVCYACEIEPAYADVIRQRYEEFVAA
jgi:DNA modification methylase